MEITAEIIEKLEKIQSKYAAIGEDFNAYLEGLLYADSVTNWDYIEVDTLLSLQKPRTKFPDEVVFIMYHQITELYFKLSLREFDQISAKEELNGKFFLERVTRINRLSMTKFRNYLRLMRLDKPTGIHLLFLPCSWACMLALDMALGPRVAG